MLAHIKFTTQNDQERVSEFNKKEFIMNTLNKLWWIKLFSTLTECQAESKFGPMRTQPTTPATESLSDHFHHIAHKFSTMMGTPWSFMLALFVIILWLLSGPFFGYSDTWQLIINTSTTIVTFLMVFLIQNTQNRDARAIHLKLDELIRATKEARNSLLDLEAMTDNEMDALQAEFDKLKNEKIAAATEF